MAAHLNSPLKETQNDFDPNVQAPISYEVRGETWRTSRVVGGNLLGRARPSFQNKNNCPPNIQDSSYPEEPTPENFSVTEEYIPESDSLDRNRDLDLWWDSYLTTMINRNLQESQEHSVTFQRHILPRPLWQQHDETNSNGDPMDQINSESSVSSTHTVYRSPTIVDRLAQQDTGLGYEKYLKESRSQIHNKEQETPYNDERPNHGLRRNGDPARINARMHPTLEQCDESEIACSRGQFGVNQRRVNQER